MEVARGAWEEVVDGAVGWAAGVAVVVVRAEEVGVVVRKMHRWASGTARKETIRTGRQVAFQPGGSTKALTAKQTACGNTVKHAKYPTNNQDRFEFPHRSLTVMVQSKISVMSKWIEAEIKASSIPNRRYSCNFVLNGMQLGNACYTLLSAETSRNGGLENSHLSL